MSLREDLHAMERHQSNGTLREWFEGTAPELPREPYPTDRSTRPGLSDQAWLRARGE